jgi:hypothetical protein
MAEFDRLVSTALPAMAANCASIEDTVPPDAWSIDDAEAALFERLGREDIKPDSSTPPVTPRSRPRLSRIIGIAAILLSACGLVGYQRGVLQGRTAVRAPNTIAEVTTPQELQVHRNGERSSEPLNGKQSHMAERVVQLEQRLARDESKLRAFADQRRALLEQTARQSLDLNQEQARGNDLEHRLSAAQDNVRTLQSERDQAANQLALANTSSSVALQKRLAVLTAELAERSQEVAKQHELLEHDQDIRNLMGARDLYIGEIYDVAKSGETQKPFGRVFYTQGKSMVFYAYDLDQQPGVKLASTFQAWGRRGIDHQHDVSLGIFYQDDQNKKRWVLKSSDSATLSRLDAVFVTVEPHGESSKPTGKPLLFTYLKLPPNHP